MAEGVGDFQLDTVHVRLEPGEALLISPGVLHSGISADKQPSLYYSLVFRLDWLAFRHPADRCNGLLEPLINGRQRFPAKLSPKIPQEQEILKTIQSFMDVVLTQQSPGFEFIVKAGLLNLLGYMLQHNLISKAYTATPAERERLERAKGLIHYVELRYREKLSISELASYCNMTPHYFCRYFKGLTGMTAIEYIHRLRIQYAAGQLTATNRKVSDIALDAGFDNPSYFIQIFKKTTGRTPSEWRK